MICLCKAHLGYRNIIYHKSIYGAHAKMKPGSRTIPVEFNLVSFLQLPPYDKILHPAATITLPVSRKGVGFPVLQKQLVLCVCVVVVHVNLHSLPLSEFLSVIYREMC